jgi:hypothetical protein
MIGRLPLRLAALLLLSACASAPDQPESVARLQRDLLRAQALFDEGRLSAARSRWRQALAGGERDDDSRLIAEAQLGLGAVALELEDFAAAGEHFRAARDESAALRGGEARPLQRTAELGLVETARRRGDCGAATAGARRLLAAADAGERNATQARLTLALCLLVDGDATAALAAIDALATEAARQPALASAWHAARAAALAVRGERGAALAEGEQALTIDQRRRHPPAIAASRALLAELRAAAGDAVGAQTEAARALRIYRHTGQHAPAARLLARFPAPGTAGP